jgi:hypothetical protein
VASRFAGPVSPGVQEKVQANVSPCPMVAVFDMVYLLCPLSGYIRQKAVSLPIAVIVP